MNDVPADETGQRLRRGATRPFLVEAALVVCVLAVFVAYVAPTLDRPLLEKHAWRQTQTAFTARVFHERGIDLLHPTLPVFGEPFEVPFEFPLFQAAASVVMDAGVEDDMAMRVTGLACFLLTALLLFGLVRHVAGPISALAAVVAFVMTPFSLVWARSSMIEYLATAGAVGFTWATIVWREQPRRLPAVLALLAGLVGMLVKPTTALLWILPALLYRPEQTSARPTTLPRRAWTAALVFVPLAAAFLWTRHADAIKAASPPTAFLTSARLQEWNFGTLDQRLDPDAWLVVLKRLPSVVGLLGIFLVVAAFATWRSPQRRFWIGMWLAAIGPFLVFTNLYFQHDYYLAAVSPAFAALIGLGVGFALTPLARRPLALVSASLVLLLLVYGSLELGRGYWLRIHGADDDPQVLPLARELESLTRAGDLVAYSGLAWSPAVPYYADRWGHMLVFENDAFSFDLVHEQGYRYLLVGEPLTADFAPFERWRWLGSLGPHTYALADAPRELGDARFVATNAPHPLESTAGIRRNLRIPCDADVRIPAGRRGTWIQPLTDAPAARLAVSDELAPLPTRQSLFAARELATDGRLTVHCTGAPSLVVNVFDAAGPTGGA
jgi:hypothetical protein